MQGVAYKSSGEESLEPKWGRGVCLSICFHVALFSLVLFVPDSFPKRSISGSNIYEVNLVELPGNVVSNSKAASRSEKAKKISSPSKQKPTKRISRPKAEKKKPVVIGKRVVETKTKKKTPKIKKRKSEVSPSKLIDDAVSKIETKVKKDSDQHVERAISKLKSEVDRVQETGAGGGGAEAGITLRMYQMAVEQRIKENWSCPIALLNAKRVKDLEAVVVVKVRQDGSIITSWLDQKSSDMVFNKSVLRAVERSDPLPPFPEGYNRSFDLVEVHFNLSEMDEYY